MTDRERLDKWNSVCIENKWAKPYELEKWLLSMGINFTNSGSVVPQNTVELRNEHNIALRVNGVEGEMMATLILEVMTGMIIFPTVKEERMFWDTITKKFKKAYDVKVPEEIIPLYLYEYKDSYMEDTMEEPNLENKQLLLFSEEELRELENQQKQDYLLKDPDPKTD